MKGPDGGIGRRAGLKHQWGDPCRFDPGSGYLKTLSEISERVFLFGCTTFAPRGVSFPFFGQPIIRLIG